MRALRLRLLTVPALALSFLVVPPAQAWRGGGWGGGGFWGAGRGNYGPLIPTPGYGHGFYGSYVPASAVCSPGAPDDVKEARYRIMWWDGAEIGLPGWKCVGGGPRPQKEPEP